MKKKMNFILLVLAFLILVGGCKAKEVINDNGQDIGQDKNEVEIVEDDRQDPLEEEEDLVEVIDPKETIDLSLKPNEAGEVMILMYHNVGEEEAEWVRTPENLKRDLKHLYDNNYRAVSLKDYVNNEMKLEAGMTPVVFTFDDGNENNFRIIQDENGENVIDPLSVVGILEDFKKDYPDFGMTATFFVFGTNPFRQADFLDYKLNFLIDNGYDVGNHTLDHRSMLKATDTAYIEEGIGRQIEILNKYLPDYEINTYALCYGERPKEETFVKYLEEGQFGEISYKNIAILNVGWNPAQSPISTKFNPLSLPRIRASEMKVDNVGIYNWLEYFEKNPTKRYISDGVEEVVTIPLGLEDTINLEKISDLDLFIYE